MRGFSHAFLALCRQVRRHSSSVVLGTPMAILLTCTPLDSAADPLEKHCGCQTEIWRRSLSPAEWISADLPLDLCPCGSSCRRSSSLLASKQPWWPLSRQPVYEVRQCMTGQAGQLEILGSRYFSMWEQSRILMMRRWWCRSLVSRRVNLFYQ